MNTPDNNKTDFLIIGQGLAGSLLAWHLRVRGLSILVVDNDHRQSSSKVAAGLVNPVIGKRLSAQAQVHQYLEQAAATYQAFEDFFKQRFYFPKPMLRLIKDEQQAVFLEKRLQQPIYKKILGQTWQNTETFYPFKNTHGAVSQKQTGYLDIKKLLHSMRNWLQQHNQLSSQAFHYDQLKLKEDSVEWQNQRFSKVIFCEGHQLSGNPWFDWLPLQKAKGDILTLHSNELSDQRIINRGNWLLPINKNQYKTGASSYWQFDHDRPEPAQKQQVLQNFEQLFEKIPEYQIINHQAGIRPATRDKMPFLGSHPEYSPLSVFNGFGAHGSLMMPFYALKMLDWLTQDKPLENTVDIQRHWKKT